MPAVEARQHRQRRAGQQRSRDDGEPADVRQRQAGEPVVVARDAESGARRQRRSGDGGWVRMTPLGSPVEPLVATTRASLSAIGRPPRESFLVPSSRRTTPTARACKLRCRGRRREALIDREGGVATSHTWRRASTYAGPAGRSRATSSPHDPRPPSCRSRDRDDDPIVGCSAAAADAAGGDRPGRPRHRLRRRRGRSHGGGRRWRSSSASPCRSGSTTPTITPTAPRHRRRAGRPAALGRLGTGEAGQVKRAAWRRSLSRPSPDWPGGDDVVVAAGGRCGQCRRGLGVHGRAVAVRLRRTRRAVRLHLLRARRHGRDDLRGRSSGYGLSVVIGCAAGSSPAPCWSSTTCRDIPTDTGRGKANARRPSRRPRTRWLYVALVTATFVASSSAPCCGGRRRCSGCSLRSSPSRRFRIRQGRAARADRGARRDRPSAARLRRTDDIGLVIGA